MSLLQKILGINMELQKIEVEKSKAQGRLTYDIGVAVNYHLVGTKEDKTGFKISMDLTVNPVSKERFYEKLYILLYFIVDLTAPYTQEEFDEYFKNVNILNDEFMPYADSIIGNITKHMNVTPLILSKLIALKALKDNK